MGLGQILYPIYFVDTIRRPQEDEGAVALLVLFLCNFVLRCKHWCEESRTLGRGKNLCSPLLAWASMALTLCDRPRNAGEDNCSNGRVYRLPDLKQTKYRMKDNEKEKKKIFKTNVYLCFIFKLTSGSVAEHPALKFICQASTCSALCLWIRMTLSLLGVPLLLSGNEWNPSPHPSTPFICAHFRGSMEGPHHNNFWQDSNRGEWGDT